VLELDALTDILLARRESNSPAKSEENPTPIKGSDLAGLFRSALDGRARGERIVIDSDEVTP
jgi:hypothetical protein